MKKLLALVLTVVFLVSVSPMAYGLSWADFDSTLGEYPTTLDLNVDSNIQVKVDGDPDEDYEEGPLTEQVSSNGDFPSFTFRDILYLDSVRDAFNLYWTAGTIKAGGDAAKLNRLYNTKVSGQFTITVTWPNELTVPAAFLADNKDLNGFRKTNDII